MVSESSFFDRAKLELFNFRSDHTDEWSFAVQREDQRNFYISVVPPPIVEPDIGVGV